VCSPVSSCTTPDRTPLTKSKSTASHLQSPARRGRSTRECGRSALGLNPRHHAGHDARHPFQGGGVDLIRQILWDVALDSPRHDIGGDDAGVGEDRVVGAGALALVDRIAQFLDRIQNCRLKPGRNVRGVGKGVVEKRPAARGSRQAASLGATFPGMSMSHQTFPFCMYLSSLFSFPYIDRQNGKGGPVPGIQRTHP